MRLLVVVSCLLLASTVIAEDLAPVDRSVCAGCHEEAEAFAGGPHGRAMTVRGEGIIDRSCTGCHGPADRHVEDPNTENIIRRPDAKACETCHAGASQQLRRMTPAHARHNVSCLDCHASGHESVGHPYLLSRPAFELCGSCHAEQRSSANLPYAHRENADPFPCTNCHSLHGVRRAARLTLDGAGGACITCHVEKSGPYVFPHPPRSIDGCSSCHAPHGSPNPRQLTRRVVASLCIECHANVPSFHDLAKPRYQACTSCHSAVHGSNRNPSLFDE